jgi:hypothetical protein
MGKADCTMQTKTKNKEDWRGVYSEVLQELMKSFLQNLFQTGK